MNLERIDPTQLAIAKRCCEAQIAGLDEEALEDWQSFKKLATGKLLEQVMRINRDLEKSINLAYAVFTAEEDGELLSHLNDAFHYIQEAVNELQDEILPF